MNITVSVPKQYIDRMTEESKRTGIKKSEIIRRALDLYFKQEGKQ